DLTGAAHPRDVAGGSGNAVRCHAGDLARVDCSLACGCGWWVSREGHRVSQGHGGAWAIWRAMSGVWDSGAADCARGERIELLPDVSDGWAAARRSGAVEVAEGGLAAYG